MNNPTTTALLFVGAVTLSFASGYEFGLSKCRHTHAIYTRTLGDQVHDVLRGGGMRRPDLSSRTVDIKAAVLSSASRKDE
jgi:hypothetical protein